MNANEATLLYADEYSRMAETYDRVVAPRFEPIARTVAELLAPRSGELILDLATGTGLLACLLAPRVAPQTVVAIDLADEAIGVASFRAGNAGIRNVRFEMMDARNIVYHGRLFDKVGSNLGIPNLGYDRTFHEVYRLLKPGGIFVFSEWDAEPPEAVQAFHQSLEKHKTYTPSKSLAQLREAVALNRGDPEARALRDPKAVAKRLESFGFAGVQDIARAFVTRFDSLEDVVAFMTAWGWDEREVAEMSPDQRAAFREELASRLADRMTPQGLDETWTVHFATARVE
jgi:ubiquinone/menaquinone biosynthesis C-methylase UbiE